MRHFSMLVLTDHSNHSPESALYPLVQSMMRHPRCARIDVATRANALNTPFFDKHLPAGLFVQAVDEGFRFHPNGNQFRKQRKQRLRSYDVVWLRVPAPLSSEFLHFLKREYPSILFINDPKGILETGNKSFLLNFQDLCPPLRLCKNLSDIEDLKRQYPLVLKPVWAHDGGTIIRIEGEQVWEGNQKTNFASFSKNFQSNGKPYLGVKYLKNVSKGDKRIVVVNGKVLGASLRLPPKHSWICNVSMGGTSHLDTVDEHEQSMVDYLTPILRRKGILTFELDTLVGDDGTRVLSNINTTNIGSLPIIERQSGQQVTKIAGNYIWEYITEKLIED